MKVIRRTHAAVATRRIALLLVLGYGVALAMSLSKPVHAQATAPGSKAAPGAATTPAASTPAVKVEEQAAFTVVGLSVRTSGQKEAGGNGVIPPLWMRVMQQGLLENVPNRADESLTVVYTDFASDQDGEYTYVLGVRVKSVGKLPEGFVAVTVPAGRYAIVPSDQGQPQEVLPAVWKKIFAMSPAALGGTRAFKADYEVFPGVMNGQDIQVDVHLGLK